MLNTMTSTNCQGFTIGKEKKKTLYGHLKSSRSSEGKFIANNTYITIDV